MFLDIATELRLLIYEFYFDEARRVVKGNQPSNSHYYLLHTCRQLAAEAGPILRPYVSLRNERQIHAFISCAGNSISHIRWADVASDGRTSTTRGFETVPIPASQLYVALRKLPFLQHLRIFECLSGFSLKIPPYSRIRSDMEGSLFPSGSAPKIVSYEIYLAAETRVTPFTVVSPASVRRLRLTGDCHFPDNIIKGTNSAFSSLHSLTMDSITGNMFDRHGLSRYFPDAVLETFIYRHEHRMGFEIRDIHLLSLTNGYGARLRKLVLLGCSRAGSAIISHCLQNLPVLEYFAISLLTVEEVRDNFILSLPTTLVVFKLAIRSAWYALPLETEERALLQAAEECLLCRRPRLQTLCLDFREKLMVEGGRRDRLMAVALQERLDLSIGIWDVHEKV